VAFLCLGGWRDGPITPEGVGSGVVLMVGVPAEPPSRVPLYRRNPRGSSQRAVAATIAQPIVYQKAT
jgi:hypothetical protein